MKIDVEKKNNKLPVSDSITGGTSFLSLYSRANTSRAIPSGLRFWRLADGSETFFLVMPSISSLET